MLALPRPSSAEVRCRRGGCPATFSTPGLAVWRPAPTGRRGRSSPPARPSATALTTSPPRRDAAVQQHLHPARPTAAGDRGAAPGWWPGVPVQVVAAVVGHRGPRSPRPSTARLAVGRCGVMPLTRKRPRPHSCRKPGHVVPGPGRPGGWRPTGRRRRRTWVRAGLPRPLFRQNAPGPGGRRGPGR